ncbi:hypothetical protein [Streptomyces sp. V1I6]|uniref:hypothetical protein n=1 Tax=Streptomyces sp. V1I6 TaxID=3042273 RepID=UPI00278AF6EF|nr:hypothetical protein [Streptomyces sp. V1I6]MDQ0847037.1 hypothetical protein [Streptomyces sp. V1I6]
MLNRFEIRVMPPGPRWPAQLQLWVDGADVVAPAVGGGGRGPFLHEASAAGRDTALHATAEGRRVVLGEPECTGGCCGFLSVFVQRLGDIVDWSGWEVPYREVAPPAFHFDAGRYDAELARAAVDPAWGVCLEERG